MEQKLQRNIVWFFSLLLLTSFLGFYPTYLVKAPTFEGFKTAHHFHGLMALLWILLLIVQPLLIRLKKNALHKQVGKLSYVIMPLLMRSCFDCKRKRICIGWNDQWNSRFDLPGFLFYHGHDL